jgi:opacity protein-like surface antigen
MKKTIILAAAILMSLGTFAQDRFAFGLKTGFTSTQYTTDNIKSSQWPDFSVMKEDAKAGFMAGAFLRFKLLGNVSLQPEVYYAVKKGTTLYALDAGEVNTAAQTVDIRSWNIPVLAHFNIIDLNVAKIYGVTGPVISFVTSDATKIPTYGSEDVKKANWGYQLGGGLEVWKLSLDARYEWGLNNVSEGFNDVSFERKSNMLIFSLGFRLIGF